MAKTVGAGEFTRVSAEGAADNLDVTLRRRGLHRDAKINLQVRPPVTDEEIAELQEQGLLKEGARHSHYDSATDLDMGTSPERIDPEHVDAAIGIAETLARMREVDSARISVMRNFTFGEAGEYLDGTILLVRQQ